MLAIVLKLLGAAAFAATGHALWKSARRWDEEGIIPADAVEATNPSPVNSGDRGFRAGIAWERIMASLAWTFAGLLVLSVILQLLGKLS